MWQLLIFYALIFSGYLIGLRYRIERALMRLLLYALLPLLILQVISRNVTLFVRILPLVFSFMLAGIAASYLLARVLFRDEEPIRRVTLTLTSVFRNALFLPLAIAIALGLPDEALVAIFAFSLSYNLLQPAITPLIVAEISKKKAKKGLKLPTLRTALIALLLGSLGDPIILPGYNALKISVSYGSLLYVGVLLARSPRFEPAILKVGLIRFFLVPTLFLLVLYRLDRPMNYVFLIEISSAPAVSNTIYAMYFDLDPPLAAKTVTYLNALGALIDYLYRLLLAP